MNKEERKEEALKLKDDHKIYIGLFKDCPDEDIENAAEVADLEECIMNTFVQNKGFSSKNSEKDPQN